eukprot:655031-Amphidinium_carterae.1
MACDLQVSKKSVVFEQEDDPLLLIINDAPKLHASLACVGSPIAPAADHDESTEAFVNWFRGQANAVRIFKRDHCVRGTCNVKLACALPGSARATDILGILQNLHEWMSDLRHNHYENAISVYKVDKRLPGACHTDRVAGRTYA